MAGIKYSKCSAMYHWSTGEKAVMQRAQSHFSSKTHDEKCNWMHLEISGLNALNCRCLGF